VARIQKIIDDYWKIPKAHSQPKFLPKEGDDEIKNIHFTVDSWIIKDPFSELRRISFPRNDAFEKHVLLSQPVA
jgi:hypothetical protein